MESQMSDHSTITPREAIGQPSEFCVHEAARRMQTQFLQTGSYQAADLTQVLGDMRDSVSLVVPQVYEGVGRRTSNRTFPMDSGFSVTV